MACFGSCGCEPCCMSASELAEIASTVTIDIYTLDYEPGDEPFDSDTATIDSNGCCHVATWEREAGFSYDCKKTAQVIVDESLTVSTKMIATKTHVMNPSTIVTAGVPDGLCIYTNPPNEYLGPGAESMCDEVVNCGTATKTAQRKDQIWSAVGYARREFRVAIHKLNLTCEAGQPPECKYVVEAAQGIDVALFGNLYTSNSRQRTNANVHACCTELACFEPVSHSPEPDCDDIATLSNGWSGGATVRYWIVKYKVYDTLEDIPSEIVFESTDGWPCDQFAFCTVDVENPSEDDLCFVFNTTLDPYEGGEIYTIAFMYNCGFCLDTGVECHGIGSLFVDEDTVCFGTQFPQNATCFTQNNGAFLDRFDGRNWGYPAITGDGVSTIFYSVRNAVLVSPEGCFEYPYYGVQNCEPDPPDRNSCNWYDCAGCPAGENDGEILPYQFKMHTVDAYSFSQGPGTGVDSTPICVEWLRMRVTLNP